METAGTESRRECLSLLLSWEEKAGYANLLVREETDKKTVSLFYGTLERLLTLDYYIGVLTQRDVRSLDGHTRAILRMGLYELLFQSGAPAYAVVNECVSLGRHQGERSFVNATLRKAVKSPELLTIPPASKDPVRHLSLKEGMPRWLVKAFLSRLSFGETEALLSAFNRPPRTVLRVNTCRNTREWYLSELREAGIAAEADPLSPFGILLESGHSPARLPGYAEGAFYVQDSSSQLALMALDPRPGEEVLDLCAAPGGKSVGAAIMMGDRGHVTACDLHESKLSLIESNAARLALSSLTVLENDASCIREEFLDRFDRVLCDVPCSGLGVLGKKPDLRHRSSEGLIQLASLGRRILSCGARYVKPGGVLLYSTCTLRLEENEEVVADFLANHPAFSLEDFSVAGLSSEKGALTLWPHIHGCDGFYFAKLRRCDT